MPTVDGTPEEKQHDQDNKTVSFDKEEVFKREAQNIDIKKASDDAVQIG
jgi:hypothetical protein